jgi:hypothetical protein
MGDEHLPAWVKEPKTAEERLMQSAFEFGRLVGRFQEKNENSEALLREIRKSIEELR